MTRRGLLTGLTTVLIGTASVLLSRSTYDDKSNAAPSMTALADVSGTIVDNVAISCSCTDDGNPNPPAALTYRWTQTGGTATCSIASSTSANTTANAPTVGTCDLQCTCCDSGPVASCAGLTASDTLTLTSTFTGLVDSIVAAGQPTPNFVASWSHRLYSAYTGPLGRIRRANDNAETNIAYVPATGLLDTAAVVTHCGASDCFLVTLFDESGNARDVTQATAGSQAKVYDGATGKLLTVSGLPFAYFDGTDDKYFRNDSCGISGASAVTLASFVMPDRDLLGGGRVNVAIGNATSSQAFEQYFLYQIAGTGGGYNFNRAQPGNRLGGSSQLRRWQTLDQLPRRDQLVINRINAAQGIDASTLEGEDLNTLAQLDITGNAVTNIATTKSVIGARADATNEHFAGHANFWLIAGQHYTGGALTALLAFETQLHAAMAAGKNTLGIVGQSNADYINSRTVMLNSGFNVFQVSKGAIPITNWDAGQTFYLRTLREVMRTAPGKRPFIFWAQGEYESQTIDPSGYYAKLISLMDRLKADSGRDPYWFFARLHSSATYGTAPKRAVINQAFDDAAALRPADCETIITENYGSLYSDGAHYLPALQDALMNFVQSRVNTLSPRRKKKRDRKRPDRRNVVHVDFRQRLQRAA